jgi:hypothetical protein
LGKFSLSGGKFCQLGYFWGGLGFFLEKEATFLQFGRNFGLKVLGFFLKKEAPFGQLLMQAKLLHLNVDKQFQNLFFC